MIMEIKCVFVNNIWCVLFWIDWNENRGDFDVLIFKDLNSLCILCCIKGVNVRIECVVKIN